NSDEMRDAYIDVFLYSISNFRRGPDKEAGRCFLSSDTERARHPSNQLVLTLGRIGDEKSACPGDFYFLGIASDSGAMIFQYRNLVCESLRGSTIVPLVRVMCDRPEHQLLSRATYHQRRSRLLKRFWIAERIL